MKLAMYLLIHFSLSLLFSCPILPGVLTLCLSTRPHTFLSHRLLDIGTVGVDHEDKVELYVQHWFLSYFYVVVKIGWQIDEGNVESCSM